MQTKAPEGKLSELPSCFRSLLVVGMHKSAGSAVGSYALPGLQTHSGGGRRVEGNGFGLGKAILDYRFKSEAIQIKKPQGARLVVEAGCIF